MQAIADILIVDDNPADQRLTLEALLESGWPVTTHVVADGEAALSYLHDSGAASHCRTPDLILLDLNLPKKDGREFLAEIKEDPRFSAIPVVILSSSESDEDIRRCYELSANCYITKPVDLDTFFLTIKEIEFFWLNVAKPAAYASKQDH